MRYYCSRCDFGNHGKKTYCQRCHYELKTPCKECGSQNTLTSRFCGDCGAKSEESLENLPLIKKMAQVVYEKWGLFVLFLLVFFQGVPTLLNDLNVSAHPLDSHFSKARELGWVPPEKNAGDLVTRSDLVQYSRKVSEYLGISVYKKDKDSIMESLFKATSQDLTDLTDLTKVFNNPLSRKESYPFLTQWVAGMEEDLNLSKNLNPLRKENLVEKYHLGRWWEKGGKIQADSKWTHRDLGGLMVQIAEGLQYKVSRFQAGQRKILNQIFTDIGLIHPLRTSLDLLAAKGFFQPYQGYFSLRPSEPLTQKEFSWMMVHLFLKNSGASRDEFRKLLPLPHPFNLEDTFATLKHLNWLSSLEHPDKGVTRGEFARTLYLTLKEINSRSKIYAPPVDGLLTHWGPFSDVLPTHQDFPAVSFFAKYQFPLEESPGVFGIDRNLTREEGLKCFTHLLIRIFGETPLVMNPSRLALSKGEELNSNGSPSHACHQLVNKLQEKLKQIRANRLNRGWENELVRKFSEDTEKDTEKGNEKNSFQTRIDILREKLGFIKNLREKGRAVASKNSKNRRFLSYSIPFQESNTL